ncbi:MAG: DUF5719 family protein [Streptosporangiaceae bacterium]
MRGLFRNQFVVAALVLAVVAALYAAAGLSHHPVAVAQTSPPGQAGRAAVSSASRACPSPGSPGATSGGVAIASAPAGAGTGDAVLNRLSPTGSAAPGPAAGSVSEPGKLSATGLPVAQALPKTTGSAQGAAGGSVPTTPGRGGVMISASGALSQGLEVEQTDSSGLVTARCEEPGTDFWFVGPGQQSTADIQLSLMNVDGQQADAQVTALTDNGPLLGGTDTGIAVPAHGLVVQSLAKLLHRTRFVALHVTASLGRIVAAVRETTSAARPGAWLPVTQAPAKRSVLPGLPATGGTRQLYVAVPGAANAQVKITAVTPKGSYQPTGGGGLNLPGGSAVGIPLPSLHGIPAAIEVSANVPVAASMMVPGGAAGAPGAFTAATGPIHERGVIADLPRSAGGTAEIVLSATGGAASVRIQEATSAAAFGSIPGRVVQIAAGHTVVVRLRPPPGAARTAAFATMISPLAGSGPVYAGTVISSGGSVRSILPVASSLTWVPLPAVTGTLTAVLP